MPPPHRKVYNSPGQAHELTFSCYRGYRFLDRERIRHWLAEAIIEAAIKHDYAVVAYVFMPEHAHLIVLPRSRAYDISAFLKDVKAPVGRKAIDHLEMQGDHVWLERITRRRGKRIERVFWQSGGGYDRNVHEPDTLRSMIDYAHNNPLRRGLVQQATDWPWSSARWYAFREPGAVKVDPIGW